MSSSPSAEPKAQSGALRSPAWWIGPVAWLGRALLRALWLSYRLEILEPQKLARVAGSERPPIYLVWHYQTLLSAALVKKRLLKLPRTITVMVSQSRDGDLTAALVEPFGLRVYRGSATRGGSRALRGLYRDLAHHDSSVLLFPDGPKGPELVVKPGAVVLAQLTGAPILPLGFAARRASRLGSWDRLVVPWPFTRIVVAVGEARAVPKQLAAEERERICHELEHELEQLGERAREAL